jgi:DNA-binding NarL/FixJ family response regulator
VRVLLADVDGAGRRALSSLLDLVEGVTVVGEVARHEDVGAAIRRLRPDALVIDDRLLRAGASFGPVSSAPRVIVVGVDDAPGYAARARALGAEAWIAKERAGDELPALLAPGLCGESATGPAVPPDVARAGDCDAR